MEQVVFGRERELAAVREFVDGLDGPAALLLEGEAGIGKTTLWTCGIEWASDRGHCVLTCRPGEGETRLSFAALADLLGRTAQPVLRGLPMPARRALEIALLLQDATGPLPSQRAVAAGALAVVRALANDRPVLIAIDDVQWLDRPTAGVLEFVVRRLEREPVALLLARRGVGADRPPLGLERALPEERLHLAQLGPLSLGAIHELVRTRLGIAFPRPLLRRVRQASGGNPFFALELSRALQRRQALPGPGQPLPVTRGLHELIGERMDGLPPNVREVLLVAAALSQPTAELVETALGEDDDAAAALEQAVALGELVLDGDRVRLTHPLPASVLYTTSSPGRRRRLHRRLADVVRGLEERARHLALSAAGPDAEVARVLDDAAEQALSRGAPETATELSELALRLTPGPSADDRIERLRKTADYSYRAGDLARSRTLREELLAALPSGSARAATLLGIAKSREDDFEAALDLCEQALREAAGDALLQVEINLFVGIVWIIRSDLRRARAASRSALELAESVEQPAIVTKAIAQVALLETWIGEITPGLLERGAELEQTLAVSPDFFASASAVLGRRLLYAGELDEARIRFERAYAVAVESGNEPSRLAVILSLSELECRAGNLSRAEQLAVEGYDIVEQLGLEQSRSGLLYARALVDAHLGRVDEARAEAEEAAAISEGVGGEIFRIQSLGVLGFVELSLGEAAAAEGYLAPLPQTLTTAGYGNPSFCPVLPNAIEACIGAGDLDRSRLLLRELERQSDSVDSAWSRAVTGRCRGLVAAAEGDSAGAILVLEQAVRDHEQLPMPFERGRTLLTLGSVLRRARRRRAARKMLERSLAVFEELGASLWADKARGELGRIGGRTPTVSVLTPSERRVAELVAEGRSNKNVAAALFVSPKTVDYHLSRIYEKLGVHSRTELARHLLGRLPQ